jgi:hypothetical protein
MNRYGLLQTMFKQIHFVEVWLESRSERLEIAPELKLPALVTLLKFADGQVHSDSKPPLIEPRPIIWSLEIFVRDEVNQLFDSTHSFSISETGDIATCVQLYLGMFETLLDPEKGPGIPAANSCELAAVLISMTRRVFD